MEKNIENLAARFDEVNAPDANFMLDKAKLQAAGLAAQVTQHSHDTPPANDDLLNTIFVPQNAGDAIQRRKKRRFGAALVAAMLVAVLGLGTLLAVMRPWQIGNGGESYNPNIPPYGGCCAHEHPHTFMATILEFYEYNDNRSVLVYAHGEGSITFGINNLPDIVGAQVGDIVAVYFDGAIRDSHPMQINAGCWRLLTVSPPVPPQAPAFTDPLRGAWTEINARPQYVGLPAASSTPVFPSYGGTVTHAGWLGGMGNAIIIDHGNGWVTHYAHLSRIYARVDDIVTADQVIGRVGSTGNSTGPHLRFEIWHDDTAISPVTLVTFERDETVPHFAMEDFVGVWEAQFDEDGIPVYFLYELRADGIMRIVSFMYDEQIWFRHCSFNHDFWRAWRIQGNYIIITTHTDWCSENDCYECWDSNSFRIAEDGQTLVGHPMFWQSDSVVVYTRSNFDIEIVSNAPHYSLRDVGSLPPEPTLTPSPTAPPTTEDLVGMWHREGSYGLNVILELRPDGTMRRIRYSYSSEHNTYIVECDERNPLPLPSWTWHISGNYIIMEHARRGTERWRIHDDGFDFFVESYWIEFGIRQLFYRRFTGDIAKIHAMPRAYEVFDLPSPYIPGVFYAHSAAVLYESMPLWGVRGTNLGIVPEGTRIYVDLTFRTICEDQIYWFRTYHNGRFGYIERSQLRDSHGMMIWYDRPYMFIRS